MVIKQAKTSGREKSLPSRSPVYPFTALVGQEEMKLGLILNVIDPAIGGVLIMGHRGTGKSTAVRGLAELLPEIWVAKRCPYRCDPSDIQTACDACREQLASEGKLERERTQVAVVDLPLGATEDRVCGSIDIQRALAEGVKAFEPGLLARANRGFLYIDEVNLLEDHLVDLLLDVSVTGQNRVERENISVAHPARFVLIGSGNPEEGELRPQLLDRFGLNVEVKTETELDDRVEIVERREAFQRHEESFAAAFAAQQAQLRKQIIAAQKHVGSIKIERPLLRKIAELCGELGIDGHRGELTISRAARSLAAFEGKKKVGAAEIKRVAAMALRHRLRRDPLEERAESERIQQAIRKTFTETRMNRSDRSGDDGDQGGHAKNLKADDSSASERSSADRRRVASASGSETAGDKTTSLPVGDLKDSDVRLPEMPPSRRDFRSDAPSKSNRRAGSNTARNHLRGRYVRATAARNDGSRVAVAASLRASVLSQVAQLKSTNRRISPDGLRFQELSCKTGRLFIFAIDTSGSMALYRIKQARIAVLSLLKQSYIHRDQVAIIGFRGESAELCLPVSRSILRARRVLDSLRVGGGTPLSAGLTCALKLAKAAGTKVGETSVLLFTDGHANVAISTTSDSRARQETINQELAMLGSAFRKERVGLTVVDTQNTFIRSGEAAAVAKRLGAQYRSLKV